MDKHSGTRPTRREHPVSVEEITLAALALIDAEGLESLTMRKLADTIGVRAMTLYRYLPNKDAILAAVADHLWRDLPPIDPSITGWKARLIAMWRQLYDLMRAHPHAVELIARAGTYSATATTSTAGMLAVLKEAGFTPQSAAEFVHAASALTVGYSYANLWQHQAGINDAGSPAPRPAPPLPPDIAPYAQALGPFTADEFTRTLQMLADMHDPESPPASRSHSAPPSRPAEPQ